MPRRRRGDGHGRPAASSAHRASCAVSRAHRHARAPVAWADGANSRKTRLQVQLVTAQVLVVRAAEQPFLATLDGVAQRKLNYRSGLGRLALGHAAHPPRLAVQAVRPERVRIDLAESLEAGLHIKFSRLPKHHILTTRINRKLNLL